MIGYDSKKKQQTTYRIDRMMDITILDELQDGEENLNEFKKDLPFRTQSIFNMFGGEKQWVTLRAPRFYYYAIEDKFGNNLLPRTERDKNGAEYVVVTVPVVVSPQFFAWVFGMEKYITIIGPDDVVKQMRAMLDDVRKKYLKKGRNWEL